VVHQTVGGASGGKEGRGTLFGEPATVFLAFVDKVGGRDGLLAQAQAPIPSRHRLSACELLLQTPGTLKLHLLRAVKAW